MNIDKSSLSTNFYSEFQKAAEDNKITGEEAKKLSSLVDTNSNDFQLLREIMQDNKTVSITVDQNGSSSSTFNLEIDLDLDHAFDSQQITPKFLDTFNKLSKDGVIGYDDRLKLYSLAQTSEEKEIINTLKDNTDKNLNIDIGSKNYNINVKSTPLLITYGVFPSENAMGASEKIFGKSLPPRSITTNQKNELEKSMGGREKMSSREINWLDHFVIDDDPTMGGIFPTKGAKEAWLNNFGETTPVRMTLEQIDQLKSDIQDWGGITQEDLNWLEQLKQDYKLI